MKFTTSALSLVSIVSTVMTTSMSAMQVSADETGTVAARRMLRTRDQAGTVEMRAQAATNRLAGFEQRRRAAGNMGGPSPPGAQMSVEAPPSGSDCVLGSLCNDGSPIALFLAYNPSPCTSSVNSQGNEWVCEEGSNFDTWIGTATDFGSTAYIVIDDGNLTPTIVYEQETQVTTSFFVNGPTVDPETGTSNPLTPITRVKIYESKEHKDVGAEPIQAITFHTSCNTSLNQGLFVNDTFGSVTVLTSVGVENSAKFGAGLPFGQNCFAP